MPGSRLISEGLKSASERQFRERLDEMLSHLAAVPFDDRIVQQMNLFLIYGNSVSGLSVAIVDSAVAKTFGAGEVERMKEILPNDIRNEGVVIGDM
ncbi:MAG: hypothetical protein PHE53_01905 [Thermoguttaceae bacterium]|nr:hypothetical protein [Thermoguttaceae bacterium]